MGIITKCGWYFNRLRAMSGAEIIERLKDARNKRIWRNKNDWAEPAPNVAINDPWVFVSPLTSPCTDEAAELIAEAEAILKGDYHLLNFSFHEKPIDWHTDSASGKKAPLDFCFDVNYREPEIVGNIKNTWEKNRHHHLTVTALAFAITGDEKFADETADQLEDWIDKNRFPKGTNWSSSLELGVRLISWVWIERLLRKSKRHPALFGKSGKLWSAIYRHQWMIENHHSSGSSANNHLIGEMAGLYMASIVWPCYAESAGWQKFAKQKLEEEIFAQTFDDGINRELAFTYQIFSTEFFLLCAIEGKRKNDNFSDGYLALLKKSIEVIPRLADYAGNLPSYGDGDNGMALDLRPYRSSDTDWIYRLCGELFTAKLPAPGSKSGRLPATVIAGKNLPTPEGFIVPEKSEAFRKAGIYVMTSNRGKDDELFVIATAGPLGFLSIAAHGHANALAFTLSACGREFLIDPGTYVYHAEPAWRSYFRSTKAHNTITIDGKDQSESSGPFLWTSKAVTHVESWETDDNGATLVASHDGYKRLPGSPIHKRKIIVADKQMEITDFIEGDGKHDIDFRMQFHPEVTVTIEGAKCKATRDGVTLAISLEKKLEYKIEQGWYSPAFNVKKSAPLLSGRVRAKLPVRLSHTIKLV